MEGGTAAAGLEEEEEEGEEEEEEMKGGGEVEAGGFDNLFLLSKCSRKEAGRGAEAKAEAKGGL